MGKSAKGYKKESYVTFERRGQRAYKVISVDDRAATRESIFKELKKQGIPVNTRSDWGAKRGNPSRFDGMDWNYHSIAIHHAGHSYSCGKPTIEQAKNAEKRDIHEYGHLSYHYAVSCDGTILELLDIWEKGAHIDLMNTGVIGIVLLADLSVRGEDMKVGEGKGIGAIWNKVMPSSTDWLQNDKQYPTLSTLVSILLKYFHIKKLGGHREFQKIATNTARTCPGTHGMIMVDLMRRDFGLSSP